MARDLLVALVVDMVEDLLRWLEEEGEEARGRWVGVRGEGRPFSVGWVCVWSEVRAEVKARGWMGWVEWSVIGEDVE